MDSGGFEPPDALTSLVFKTSAINQALPTVHDGLVPVFCIIYYEILAIDCE